MVKNINTKEFWNEEWFLKRKRVPRTKDYLFKEIEGLIPEGLSIIDLGCGNGRFLWKLKRKNRKNLYGVDISSLAIEMLSVYGIKGEVGNLENFDYFKKKFDIVILSHTLEHITNDEDLIKNIARITKKFAIVIVPNNWVLRVDEKTHMRIYSFEGFLALMLRHFKKCEKHNFKKHLILRCYV